MKVDTSREAVEKVAAILATEGDQWQHAAAMGDDDYASHCQWVGEVAALLRALLDERDALRAVIEETAEAISGLNGVAPRLHAALRKVDDNNPW